MAGMELAIKRIKDRVPLASLIRESIELKQRSGRLLGLCPFHNEKTPSFYVFDNNYYCFGCQAKGDCIEYVKQTQGLNFIDTLKYLGRKYSIPLPELENSEKRMGERVNLEPLYKSFQVAQELFVRNLQAPEGQKARHYLQQRGFSEENIKAFGFGVSMDSYSQLFQYLKRAGLDPQHAIKVHLLRASQRPDRDPYDFFRNRLMIPIRDQFGRIVGMGGRTLSDDPVKYVNSQNHILYDKKSVLFGFDRARKIIKKKNRAIVVEGYMDALQLWQSGFDETTAVLGTSLSRTHLHQLSGSTSHVTLVFDGDKAGQAASLRTIDLMLEVANLNATVVRLPEGDDPDSYIKKHGATAFEQQLAKAQDLLDFAIRHEIQQSGNMNLPTVVSQKLMPWVSQVKDPIKREFLVHKISELTGIGKKELEVGLKAPTKPSPTQPKDTQEETPAPTVVAAPTGMQLEILGHLFFAKPEELQLARVEELLNERIPLDPFWMQFAGELMSCLKQGQSPHAHPNPPWQHSGVPEIFTLIEQLQNQKLAFSTETRMAQMEALVSDQLVKTIKSEILRNKEQLALLTRQSPDQEGEILNILKRIDQLNHNLNALNKAD